MVQLAHVVDHADAGQHGRVPRHAGLHLHQARGGLHQQPKQDACQNLPCSRGNVPDTYSVLAPPYLGLSAAAPSCELAEAPMSACTV